jgi:uncharacterized membrane protein (UPF0182 family)
MLVAAAVVAWSTADYQWFRQLGSARMFQLSYGTRWAMFGVTGGFVALVTGFSAVLTRSLRPAPGLPASPAHPVRHEGAVLAGLMAAVGVAAGLAGARSWLTWVQFAHRTSFGRRDPQFHLDLSFYVFVYPFLRLVLDYLFAAVLLALVVAVAGHVLYGGLRLRPGDRQISAGARAQLGTLLGIFMLLKAAAYWLDRYGIEFSSRDVISHGASYTDVHAVLPAKTVLALVAVLCAILFFAAAARRDPLLPVVGFGLLVLSAVLIGGVYPAAVEQFSVKPHELTRETSYLDQQLGGTRRAFGLGQMRTSGFPVVLVRSASSRQRLGPMPAALPASLPAALPSARPAKTARTARTIEASVVPARFRAAARYWPGRAGYLASPLTRVAKLAPFLTWDGTVYPAVLGGQLDWVADGYTTTSWYPDAAGYDLTAATAAAGGPAPVGVGQGKVDYIRDAVKAVVSATSGRVTLYQWDSSDPVLRTWEKAFPGLIRPRSALPAAVAAQLPYPAGLFDLQAQVLARYHVSTAAAFTRPGAWVLSVGAGAAVYTRADGTELAAYLAAGRAGDGPLRLLEVPAGTDLASPGQIRRAAALADLATTAWSRP